MKKLSKDRLLGIICLLLTAFIVWQTRQIPIRAEQFATVGPRTFPMIAAVLFAICGIYFIIKKPEGPDKVYMTKKEFGRALIMWGAYLLYLALLYFFGMKIAAPIAVFVMALLFGRGKIKWWQALLYGLIFGVCFYLLYVYAFKVRVPRGIIKLF